MNGINPAQVNPSSIAPAATPKAQQRPSVEAVRALALQTREQVRTLLPLLFSSDAALSLSHEAQALAVSATQQLESAFLEPHEDHADFIRKLEDCPDDVRYNAREVTRFAISLHHRCFEAIEIASYLLEKGPSNLLVATRSGPRSLSKQIIDTALLQHLTCDDELLLGPQPGDQAKLAALYAEWSQDDSVDPYSLQR